MPRVDRNGRPGPELVGPQGEYDGIASYPFATMIWSYINQMMPSTCRCSIRSWGSSVEGDLRIGGILYEPCCLHPDEVYALTAYLLYRNDIVGEDEVLDADNLADVEMPLRGSYLPPPFLDTPWKPGMRQAEVGQPDE